VGFFNEICLPQGVPTIGKAGCGDWVMQVK